MTSGGRPNDPPSFAEGTYVAPTKPWDGLAHRQAPADRFFTPKMFTDPRAMNAFLGEAIDTSRSAVYLGGQLGALNWQAGSPTTHNLKRGAWSPIDQAWFGIGDGGNDFLEVSYDHGRNWTDLAASLGAGRVLTAVAVASGGNVAVTTNTRNVYKGLRTAFGAYTWSDNANVLSVAPSAMSSMVWDDTHGRFVVVYRSGAVGHVDYGTNPAVAFTASVLPAAWSTYAGTKTPEIQFGGGRLIAAYLDVSVPRLNIMRSLDGGATWTNVQKTLSDSAANLTAQSIMTRPTYDDANGAWYIAVSSTAGVPATEILKSTDGGATWNSVYFDALILHDLQAFGALLVAITSDHRIIFSTDGTSSWYGSQLLTGTAVQMWLAFGGGGFVTWNSADKTSFLSMRFGYPVADVVG